MPFSIASLTPCRKLRSPVGSRRRTDKPSSTQSKTKRARWNGRSGWLGRSNAAQKELLPKAALEPGVAHRAASLRYQERNVAEGKCGAYPKPLDRNSVRYCAKHLLMARGRYHRKKALKDPGSRNYLYLGAE